MCFVECNGRDEAVFPIRIGRTRSRSREPAGLVASLPSIQEQPKPALFQDRLAERRPARERRKPLTTLAKANAFHALGGCREALQIHRGRKRGIRQPLILSAHAGLTESNFLFGVRALFALGLAQKHDRWHHMPSSALPASALTSGRRASSGKAMASKGGSETVASSTRVACSSQCPSRNSKASSIRASESTNQR